MSAPVCVRCDCVGRVGNPLLGHPPAELVCLRCKKAEQIAVTGRRPIAAEDRRRAVSAAMRRHLEGGRVLRITSGMRRSILHSSAYRAGRRVEDDAGPWGWP